MIYPWPDGKKMACIISLDFDGATPYLWNTRQNPTGALGELELRRFGPRQGIWRLLDLFKSLDLRVSVYIPGAIVESYPDAVKAIAENGHEIGLHGFMHEHIRDLSDVEFAVSMEKSMSAMAKVGIDGPFGFRSPAWDLTESALMVLERFGVSYDSSLMGFDQPYWISKMVELPVQWPLDDAIFYRYVPGSMWPPVRAEDVVGSWRLELEGAKRYQSLFMLTMHPWLSGRSGRLVALEGLLKDYRDDPEIWWTTSDELAHYHRQRFPEGPFHDIRLGSP